MDQKSQIDELEVHIRAIIHQLLELAVSPHIRELRAKAVTYGRVIGNWQLYPPTQPQYQAMVECVGELDQKVKDAAQDAGVIRESGRMPSSRGMKRPLPTPTPPAIRPIQGSELDAFEAALRGDDPDATAIHSRNRARKASTKPPPAKTAPRSEAPRSEAPRNEPSHVSRAPVSHQRPASDTRPTPVPALLQTRRSR